MEFLTTSTPALLVRSKGVEILRAGADTDPVIHVFNIEKSDRICLTTDGFISQNKNISDAGTENLAVILDSIKTHPVSEQKKMLLHNLESQKEGGVYEDDILLISFGV